MHVVFSIMKPTVPSSGESDEQREAGVQQQQFLMSHVSSLSITFAITLS